MVNNALAVVPSSNASAKSAQQPSPNGEAKSRRGSVKSQPEDEVVPVEWLFLFVRKTKRERFLMQLISYVIFIAIFTTICSLLRPIRTTFTMQDTIVERTARDAVPGANWEKTFYDITSDGDWIEWVETLLLPTILDENWYNGDPRSASWGRRFSATVSMYNTQVALVRFRQARVTDDSCDTPARNSELSRPCWGPFTQKKQFKEAFGEEYGNRFLTGLNGITGKEGFGVNYGDEAHVVDMPLDLPAALAIFAQMKDGLWLNEQTRAISIESSWYNANLDVSTYCRWHVDFSPGGRVQPYLVIESCRLFPYSTTQDLVRAALEITFCILLVYFIGQEINEWYSAPVRRTYFMSFWNLLEIANLLLFIVIMVTWAFYVWGEDKSSYKIVNYEGYNSRPDLSRLASLYNQAANLAAFNIIFSYVKLFKFLQMYPSLSILWRTLKLSMADTAPFLLVFLVFTVGFTFAAHWIFGYMMVEFHSWMQSFSTLLQALVGGLPFEGMKLFAPISAIVFAVAWILVMAMVLVNMFVAILTEWYLQVNEENRLVDQKLEEKTGANAQAGILTLLWTKIRSLVRGVQNIEIKDLKAKATSNIIFGNNPVSQSVSKYVKQSHWQDTEKVRKAVAQGKPFKASEMAAHFRGDQNKAYDFLNLLKRLAGGAPQKQFDQEKREQEQIQVLQQTVDRLEGHLRLLRAALHETGAAPLQPGQELGGYLVDHFPEPRAIADVPLQPAHVGMDAGSPRVPGAVTHD
mmetsp:Transcript_26852/g.61928  ORF Transcript_26852/g.61928 Transcript_26852/m.61928 type:complete len:748 (-) Transcript_26852:9-2252(-)